MRIQRIVTGVHRVANVIGHDTWHIGSKMEPRKYTLHVCVRDADLFDRPLMHVPEKFEEKYSGESSFYGNLTYYQVLAVLNDAVAGQYLAYRRLLRNVHLSTKFMQPIPPIEMMTKWCDYDLCDDRVNGLVTSRYTVSIENRESIGCDAVRMHDVVYDDKVREKFI